MIYFTPLKANCNRQLFFFRTILAALHFNHNLHRDGKKDNNGEQKLCSTYIKFKEGDCTVREVKVQQNYGTVLPMILFYSIQGVPPWTATKLCSKQFFQIIMH